MSDDFPLENGGSESLPNPFGEDDNDSVVDEREALVTVAGVYEHRASPEDQAPDFLVLLGCQLGRK